MNWTKLDPIKATIHGCATCSGAVEKAEMDMLIAVGFGEAYVSKDGVQIYNEIDCQEDENALWTFQEAENEALKDPDHDWRVVLYAPLRGATYQRQGDGEWFLVGENMGFA